MIETKSVRERKVRFPLSSILHSFYVCAFSSPRDSRATRQRAWFTYSLLTPSSPLSLLFLANPLFSLGFAFTLLYHYRRAPPTSPPQTKGADSRTLLYWVSSLWWLLSLLDAEFPLCQVKRRPRPRPFPGRRWIQRAPSSHDSASPTGFVIHNVDVYPTHETVASRCSPFVPRRRVCWGSGTHGTHRGRFSFQSGASF